MAWTILQQDHQRNIFAKLYWNRSSGLDKNIFKVFYIDYIGKISPAPWRPCFFDESKWLEQSCNRTTKGTFLQNYMEISPVVSDKKIFKVFYMIYRENKPRPWRPCFLTNPNGLNNLATGSPKEHFCKIILKSVQWFRTIFKVFYIDI